MLRTFLRAYPWDLIDEGVGPVLDRLHGEVGATGVSVWVALAPLTQLRVRDVQPRVFRTRGGLFFGPDEQHYVGTRCKPIVSGWVKARDPLARIADACIDAGMELRVIVSAAMTGRLAQRHPDMACKNALGAESHVSLCLANPDVQTYLCGLVADLSSNYSLFGVTVTDLVIAWAEACAGNLRVAAPLGAAETSLLETCFCESCNQGATAADVDVAMAMRSVQVILQKSLDGGATTPPSPLDKGGEGGRGLDAIVADSEPLAAFYRWRAEELSSLLRRLTEACRCELLLDRADDGVAGEQNTLLDLSLPAAIITRLNHPEEPASALCPAARRNELRLPEGSAIGTHAPDLVRTLSQAMELGFAGVEIDNYGLLPDSALTSIKQAIRFARRSTSRSGP